LIKDIDYLSNKAWIANPRQRVKVGGRLERGFILVGKDLYKTIMGTIPKSSSHSPSAAEAADGVRLLLL
jgi:hypothetical protein